MKNLILFIFFILALPFMSVLTGCHHKTQAWDVMNKVEVLMNPNPDSAFIILSSLDKNKLGDDEEKARYALLMSMVLDKIYIDTTTFDILQPAIDYYLIHGSADEKLRTLYYQGRIFQNRDDYDLAMQSFLKASDLKEFKDSLTYANMLVAQSNLYFKSFLIDDYIINNLKASKIFEKFCFKQSEQICLIKALDGCVILNNKVKADSIISHAVSLSDSVPEFNEILSSTMLMYKIKFGNIDEINLLLDSMADLKSLDDELKLNMSLGYLNINKPHKALLIFESIDSTSSIVNTIKYLSIRPQIYEANKKLEDAIQAFKEYMIACDAENNNISYQKITIAEDRHKAAIENLNKLQKKDKQILFGFCTLLILIIIIGVFYYQLRIGKAKTKLSEQERTRLKLENDNLQTQNKVLELETHSANLEREKQCLASENMALRISQLEDESENLRNLLRKSELSKPILEAIQERIGMLNGVFAAHITDDANYSKPYDKWIGEVTADKNKFMNSTRLAFWASHPKFMEYLDMKGLTESELNYVCLYAIGLRGKEVGKYIQIKRHYHISSDVRKKLGLKDSDTNLGLYIKKLMKNL